MPIRGSPNGARHPRPQAGGDRPGIGGRDQSKRMVAINWDSWSRSPGARTFAAPRQGGANRTPLGVLGEIRLMPGPTSPRGHFIDHGLKAFMRLGPGVSNSGYQMNMASHSAFHKQPENYVIFRR